MAPEGASAEDASHGKRKTATDCVDGPVENPLRTKLLRKRTKTGCLTCRKRRIKCDEERPVCKNCIKSRRHCEGYNQRVVFKAPTFDYRQVPNGAHIVFNSRPPPDVNGTNTPGYDPGAIDASLYSQLRPRALEQFVPGIPQATPGNFVADPSVQPFPLNISTAPNFPQLSIAPQDFHHHALANRDMPFHTRADQNGIPFALGSAPVTYPFMPSSSVGIATPMAMTTPWTALHASPASPKSLQNGLALHSAPAAIAAPWRSEEWPAGQELANKVVYGTPASMTMNGHDIMHQIVAIPVHTSGVAPMTTDAFAFSSMRTETATDFLRQAAVEIQDDDYYDINSDEDMVADILAVSSSDSERRQVLGRIFEMNQLALDNVSATQRGSPVYDGILDFYRVEEVANPLRNPATARLFAHFISNTGPSLSLFAKRPYHSNAAFATGQVPLSQQGLWTYAMPMAALRHQGLLHAMLALSSLQIARLHHASTTPSMQHYAWALKRIHNNVGRHTKSRWKLTTVAATMLLGFYEVLTADHLKWNTHLAGSKQLFLETNFVEMTNQFKQMKSERAARLQMGHPPLPSSINENATESLDAQLDQIQEIDEQILSQLAGYNVAYGSHGFVMTPNSAPSRKLDLKHFELLKEVYWWYLKHDAFQAIVSGNPLLLDFQLWVNCPPRAPLGQIDAVYGSLDHLIVLLGRVADFSARDRRRKLRVMKVNGGQWRPAPGMTIPKPPQNGPPPPAANQPSPPGPQFYGMAPIPRNKVEMPASYQPEHPQAVPEASASPENYDLEAATEAAIEEYNRIRAALHVFQQNLGEGFGPLTSQYHPPLDTPFGKALFYASADIACLWMVYYMTIIIAIRSHPHMHPAAHVSVGLAAPETAFFANEIGRIAAGLSPGPPDQPLNPIMVAALGDSCVPSFFAAVQYQTPAQRHVTVTRLYDIGVRTGSGSAEVIANGCETSWVKAAAMGRGPPYTRIVRSVYSPDARINGSWESDPNHQEISHDDGYDRRNVVSSSNARLNWAIGVMGTEHDETSTTAV